MSGKQEKNTLDKSDSSKVATLFKHMSDWYNDHPGSSFISPRDFQNSYPQWDKYSNDSFRKVFYSIKKRILNGEIIQNVIIILFG